MSSVHRYSRVFMNVDSDESAETAIIKILTNDSSAENLCVYPAKISLEKYMQITKAIGNSNVVKRFKEDSDYNTRIDQRKVAKEVKIKEHQSLIEALKINKSVQEFEIIDLHKTLPLKLIEMVNSNQQLRKIGISAGYLKGEEVEGLLETFSNNILLSRCIVHISEQGADALKQSIKITNRNIEFIGKAVQYASTAKDITKLPIKLLWFLKECDQEWLGHKLNQQQSTLTTTKIQKAKISSMSLDGFLRSLGVCKKMQVADESKLFLPPEIMEMILMNAYEVCLAPDFKWVNEPSKVEVVGDVVVDTETSSA